MLPERARVLLTAYVDGELSSRQRKLVVRLLEKSIEARRLLKALQQDALRLKQLPLRKLEPTFANEVVAALHQRIGAQTSAQTNTRVAGTRATGARPSWTRYAVAASVLVVLGGALWLATRQPNTPDKPGPIVVVLPEPKLNNSHGALVAKVVDGVFGGFAAPVRQGTYLPFEELAKTEWHEHLTVRMAKQTAVQLDVSVMNQRQAVLRLESVMQNKGIRVLIDAPADAMMKAKEPPRTAFVIYTENVRPDELAAMLYELGTDERARTSIEALTVSQVTDDDQKNLGKLLGIPLEVLRDPTSQKTVLNTFIPKDQKDPVAGQTGPSRTPGASESRVAMVLANEAQGGKISSQLQSFLTQRRQIQPGSLRIIVVVHQA